MVELLGVHLWVNSLDMTLIILSVRFPFPLLNHVGFQSTPSHFEIVFFFIF